MTTRKLAQFEVSSVGIGCMGFSHGNRTDEDIQRMGYVKPQ